MDVLLPLMKASQNGHCDVVKLLIEKGAEVNAQNNNGSSALMFASQKGHCDVVKLLIEKGAEVNVQINAGWSALMFASQNGHCDVVKLLIEKGAEVNVQINDGSSALMFASEKGHCDVVKLLIEKGEVNVQNNNGWSALMVASQNGHCDVVKLLIEKGADVNAQSNNGSSALMVASQNGHCDVVKLLIEKGAEVNAQNNNGSSALTLASENGHCDVVELLIENGAVINNSIMSIETAEESSSVQHIDSRAQDNHPGSTAVELGKRRNEDLNPSHLQSSLIRDSPSDVAESNDHETGTSFTVPTEVKPDSKRFKTMSDELALNVHPNEVETAADSADFSITDSLPEGNVSCLTLDDLVEKHSCRSLLGLEVKREHLVEVSRLLEHWKEFARAAGLTEPEVVGINHDENTENSRRFRALHVWHKNNAFLATNSELIRIMLCINQTDAADRVCVLLKDEDKSTSTTDIQQAQSTDIEQVSDDLVLFKNNAIGSGAFGVVFKGEFNKQPCAIKVLHALAYEIQTSYPVSKLAQKDSVTRFHQECEYLESLEHPNIVCHLATKMHPKTNHLVLVLELMDCNLRQYFTPPPGKELIKLSLTTQSSLCLDIASALEYIHSRGVIHRDLCSDNILLACGGETPVAKVCDFGMSRIIKSETQSVSLQAFAHKGYMPPEATDVESSCYNSKFDIFSFGALMVQIVRHLPTIKDRKERNYELDLIEAAHPIKALICECLREHRDDRPSASQLKRRLQHLL